MVTHLPCLCVLFLYDGKSTKSSFFYWDYRVNPRFKFRPKSYSIVSNCSLYGTIFTSFYFHKVFDTFKPTLEEIFQAANINTNATSSPHKSISLVDKLVGTMTFSFCMYIYVKACASGITLMIAKSWV